MLRYGLTVLAVLACLSTAPVSAQQRQAVPAPARASQRAPVTVGPRLPAEFPSYRPSVAKTDAAAAAASTTTITISTVALVAIGILLLLLLL
jgi:hypothetical protein